MVCVGYTIGDKKNSLIFGLTIISIKCTHKNNNTVIIIIKELKQYVNKIGVQINDN